jgi:hypothetical protein
MQLTSKFTNLQMNAFTRCILSTIILFLGICMTTLVAPLNVYAQEYKFSWSPGNAQNDSAGYIESIESTYNTVSKRLIYKVVFSPCDDGTIPNGFILSLVNCGDCTMVYSYGQLAALYLDATNKSSPVITVYSYNGLNYLSSWMSRKDMLPPDQIVASSKTAGFVNDVKVEDSNGKRIFTFDINASYINSYIPLSPNGQWLGIGFNEGATIKFYPISNMATAYDANGFLSTFLAGKYGSAEACNLPTTKTDTDCAGVVNGTSKPDACGVCGGNGSSCGTPVANGTTNPTTTSSAPPSGGSTASPTPTAVINGSPTVTPTGGSNQTPAPTATIGGSGIGIPSPTPTFNANNGNGGTPTPTTIPGAGQNCNYKDITDLIFALDGGSAALKSITKATSERLLKLDKTQTAYTKNVLRRAERLHMGAWTDAWSFPQIVANCPLAANCFSANLASKKNNYKKNVDELRALNRSLLARMKSLRIASNKRTEQSFQGLTNKHYREAIATLKNVPKSSVSCS